MLAPTPMLRPGPLDIGGLFAGSFEALKRRFGLFVLLAMLPTIAMVVVVGIGVAVIIGAAMSAAASTSIETLPIGVVVGFVVLCVGLIAVFLVQLKANAMMSVAAYEVAQGGSPSFRGLLVSTRGFLPRMASVIAIVVAAGGLVYGLFLGAFAAAALNLDGRSGDAAMGGFFALMGVIVLLVLAIIPVAYFLAVRFLYTVQATAIEQVNGLEGMKRSWRLTRGSFWRTLGYYLLASLVVGAISYVVSLLSQLLLLPVSAGLSSGLESSDPTQALAALAAMAPALVLSLVLQVAVQVLLTPFLQTYLTYMYVDQVRRSELPATPYGGTPAYGYHPGGHAAGTYVYGGPPPAYGAPPPGTAQPGYPPNQGWAPPQQPPSPGYWPPHDQNQQPPQG